MEDIKQKSKWQLLGIELKARFNNPFKHPEFIIYFFGVVFLVGISGVILTIWIEHRMTNTIPNHEFSNIHVVLSIAAYFIALLTSSAVDLILSAKSSNPDFQMQLRRSLIMIGVGAIILGLFMMWLSLMTAEICFLGYFFSVVGLLFSWYIWWITNAANPNLTDASEDPYTSIGLPINSASGGGLELSGNLTGIQS